MTFHLKHNTPKVYSYFVERHEQFHLHAVSPPDILTECLAIQMSR